ncbi:MAG: carboxypeptidase-like regulatory domain-containing protein [Acidobacteriaceae bacterium]
MRRFRSLHRIPVALLALFLLAAPSHTFAQQSAPVSGVVTDAAGQPLAGATVSSGTGSQRNATTTGADGRFQLASSTNVLHTQADGYQPRTLLINPPADNLRLQLHAITLSPLTGALIAPPCTPLQRKDPTAVRIGTPGAGLQFNVPRKGFDRHELGQGDLHEFMLQPRHSRALLILRFGANAVPPTPEDHFFLESSSFTQRAILLDDGSGANPLDSVGIDTAGTFSDGTRWRHLATPVSGATYDHATPADAALFDAIIDTLCVAPAA